MSNNSKTAIVILAISLLLLTPVVAHAENTPTPTATATETQGPLSTNTPTATVEPTATSTPTPATEPSPTATSTPEPTSTATTKPTATATPSGTTVGDWRAIVIPTPEGDRKANHGWFVSWIAHFVQTVEGWAHGLVVSFFAQSDLGKENKERWRGDTDDDETPTVTPTAQATSTSTAGPTATTEPATPTATVAPSATPTATLAATPTSTLETAQGTSFRAEEREKHQGNDKQDGNKERNRNSIRNEEQTGQTSGFAPSGIDGSETPSAGADSGAGQSPGSRGPKEGRKAGVYGEEGSPPDADEEEVHPGRSERGASEAGWKMDAPPEPKNKQSEDRGGQDPKPSPSRSAPGGQNR